MMNKIEELFNQPVKIINIGLVDFYTTLDQTGIDVRHVELKNEKTIHDKKMRSTK